MDGAAWGPEKHMAAKKIQYSVSMYPNPLHEDDPKKAYASIQLTGKYSTKDLCKHISDHNGLFPRAVVEGVLIQFCDDATCQFQPTDESGTAVFEAGEQKAYEVHVLQGPEGFAPDEKVYAAEDASSDVNIVLEKAA